MSDSPDFTNTVALSDFFNLWDRGDGIGEICLFNTLIGSVTGDNTLPDNYIYDEELEKFVEIEVDFNLVSCFPGTLNSGHEVLKPFNNTYIDCIEHLASLLQSIGPDLLPNKPKGSVIDIFSGNEKFLVSKHFDIEIIRHGAQFSDKIIENFTHFSHYFKNYFANYPEVIIGFLSHSYLNGNMYVCYEIAEKYFLHLVFNENNEMILGKINQTSQMKILSTLACEDSSYQTVCETILSSLNIDLYNAKFVIPVSQAYLSCIPKQKNKFLTEILNYHTTPFLLDLSNRGNFLVERDLNLQQTTNVDFTISRLDLLSFKEKIMAYDLDTIDTLSLLINYYLKNSGSLD